MKKILKIILCYLILILCICFLINFFNPKNNNSSNKLKVTVTLFPEYDFVKKIGKDKVSIDLLLDSRSTKPYI